MADKLGISQSTYGRHEKNISEMSVANLILIAKYLDTSLEDILDLKSNQVYENVNAAICGNSNTQSIVNDKILIEEIIKSKDKIISNLEIMLSMCQSKLEK